MSDNKLRYYSVTTTKIVKANSQREAIALVTSRYPARSGIPGEIMSETLSAERVSAAIAKAQPRVA